VIKMNKEVKIVSDKFSDQEIKYLRKAFKNKETIYTLGLYNQMKFFKIYKEYINEELKGFVVLFLGYNSLSSNDIALEQVVSLDKQIDAYEIITKLILKIKADYPEYDFYYDINANTIFYAELLKELDLKRKGKSR